MRPIKRVMQAQVYDYLELAALAFGGIGMGKYSQGNARAPHCALGYAGEGVPSCVGDDTIYAEFERLGITVCANDIAIEMYRRLASDERVSFETWCKLMRVTRGADVVA